LPRNMKGQHGKIRYSTWTFIQDIMLFIMKHLFSFLENFQKVFQGILCLRKDHETPLDSFPLKVVNTNSPYSFDLGPYPFLNLMMTILKLMNLKRSRLILQLLYILLHLVKFQIDTNHSSYLLYSMLSLKFITYICQGLMVNVTTSLLRDICIILRLSSTFLNLMKRMSVLGCFLFLGKVKSWFKNLPTTSISDFL